MCMDAAKCYVCGRDAPVFKSSGRIQKYCSKRCQGQREPPAPKRGIAAKCKVCGKDTKFFRSTGLPKKFCSKQCRSRGRKPAVRRIYDLVCEQCGSEFRGTDKQQEYCSRSCSSKSQKWLADKPCVVCGVMFSPRESNNESCSRKCGWVATGRGNKHTPEQVILSEQHEQRMKKAYSVKRRAKSKAKKLMRRLAVCGCGAACVMRVDGRGLLSIRCGACERDEQAEQHRKRTTCTACRCDKAWTKYPRKCKECRRESERNARRQREHARRAKMRAVQSEPIRRKEVFRRDGWRCQLCGVRVATYAQSNQVNAGSEATLDHIIPLARGGPHLYTNLQTACRQCNSIKSDKMVGQMRMI